MGGRGQTAGRLVTKPLDKFDDLTGKTGDLTLHSTKDYHKSCLIAMENFKLVFEHKQADVRAQVDPATKKEIEQNRAHVKPIIDTILTRSRQNIALRRHRGEEGCVDPDNEPLLNDGNFRALLRYRARGGIKIYFDTDNVSMQLHVESELNFFGPLSIQHQSL